ncbi:MAG: hypothetical protein NVSMB42_04470 [Herpetosiphon sp.]
MGIVISQANRSVAATDAGAMVGYERSAWFIGSGYLVNKRCRECGNGTVA